MTISKPGDPLDSYEALAVIVRLTEGKRPRSEPARTMWTVADHTLADDQGYPHKPKWEGEPVHWWRDGLVMSGFATGAINNSRPIVRANGRAYRPQPDDYCDQHGRRSKP